MKNEFTPDRLHNSYFLRMAVTALSVSVKKMKSYWGWFRKAAKKPPLLADAVSEGIIDFFKEMGYSANTKNKK